MAYRTTAAESDNVTTATKDAKPAALVQAPLTHNGKARQDEPPPMHPRSANSVRKPSESLLSLSAFSPSDGTSRQRCYAIDTEMVSVVRTGTTEGPGVGGTGDASNMMEKRAMVSVGIVNDRLETVLYSRVAVPRGYQVTDGAFARVHGGLWASWDEGIPASCVSDLLARHASTGGLVVGWELHGDLEVIGFKKAAALAREGDRSGLPLDVSDFANTIPDGGNFVPSSTTNKYTKDGYVQTNGCRNGRRGGRRGIICSSHDGDEVEQTGVERKQTHHAEMVKPKDTWTKNRRTLRAEKNSETNIHIEHERDNDSIDSDDAGCKGATCRNGSENSKRELGWAPGSGSEQTEEISGGRGGGGTRNGGAGGGGKNVVVRAGIANREVTSDTDVDKQRNEVVGGMTVFDVTDLYRTTRGHKCMLSEAYTCCFGRTEQGAHNAATDARMTMELYNLWRRVGEPEGPIGVPLCFFVVNFHSFKSPARRQEMLWKVLRPERGGRATVSEWDSEINTYKLFFRNERERDAYLTLLRTRMSAAGLTWKDYREDVPGRKGAKDGYQLTCGQFKMHVLEHDR